MVRIIAGGKKHASWLAEACAEYEKRLRKPFALEWQFVDEEKLPERVARLSDDDFVILLDEHGKILSSPELCDTMRGPLENGRDVVFVIGGAQIYALALDVADRIYLTRVEHDYEGDTSFPAWNSEQWQLISRETHECGEKYPHPFAFEIYERK